jgi:hydroxyacylglutathione hydrolase
MIKILQLAVGGFDKNFSYLIYDENKIAVLIDPTGDKEIIEKAIKENSLEVILQLLTHRHPDHTELVPYFKEKGIPFLQYEDFLKESGFRVGSILIKTIFTPGHTSDSVCFLIEENLFTGDTLFVKGVGTTAYGGDEKKLHNSLNKLETLPKDMIVWPGHNYNGNKTTLGDALKFAHKKPSEKVLEEIKKKVKEYEKDF